MIRFNVDHRKSIVGILLLQEESFLRILSRSRGNISASGVDAESEHGHGIRFG